jgi:hypothetical protein
MGGYTVAHLEEIEEIDDGHCNASRALRRFRQPTSSMISTSSSRR